MNESDQCRLDDEIDSLLLAIKVMTDRLRDLKSANPELRCGYYLEPGSILNAYREGDLSFEAAKEALNSLRAVQK